MNQRNVDRTIKIAEEVKGLLQKLGVKENEKLDEGIELKELVQSAENQAEGEGGLNYEKGYRHDTLLEIRNTLILLVNLKNKMKKETLKAVKGGLLWVK